MSVIDQLRTLHDRMAARHFSGGPRVEPNDVYLRRHDRLRVLRKRPEIARRIRQQRRRLLVCVAEKPATAVLVRDRSSDERNRASRPDYSPCDVEIRFARIRPHHWHCASDVEEPLHCSAMMAANVDVGYVTTAFR